MANSLLTYTVNFENDEITITATPPAGYQSANLFIEVIDPTGLAIKEADLDGTPDLVVTTTPETWDNDLPISKNSAGKYLKGTYKVTVYVSEETIETDIVTEGEPKIDTISFSFCPYTTILNINTKVNCFKGELVVTDLTNWETWSIADYLLVVVPPTVEGIPLSGASTTTQSVTVPLTYTNVTYQVNVTAQITKETTLDSMWTLNEVFTVTGYTSQKVTCNALCDVIACAQETLEELSGANCSKVMTAAETSKFLRITMNLALLGAKANCSSCEDTEDILAALKADIDCHCQDADIPMPLKSICGDPPAGNKSQHIETAGELDTSVDIVYWNVDLAPEETPTLSIDISTMEIDKQYRIICTGEYEGLRYAESPLANVWINGSPPAFTSRAFLFAGGGIATFILVSDGTTIYSTNPQ